MKRNLAILLAVVMLLSVAGCMRTTTDNPAYSVQPADTVEGLG